MNDIKGNEAEAECSYFEPRVCVIGSGVAVSDLTTLFSVKYKTILFDVDQARVNDIEKIRQCNFYVVALSTPEVLENHPDLQPLWRVCEILGKVISGGDIVVCESTFNPADIEEECIYLIEKMSGLTCHIDFFAGCSPRWSGVTNELPSATKFREEIFRSTPEIGKIVKEVYSGIMISPTEDFERTGRG